jgi:para-nitrobenzyl esterase
MGLPSARPLFHQMISESGGAERVSDVVGAAEVAEGFATQWRTGGASLDSLRTAPATDLIAAQDHFLGHWPRHFPLRPEIDGALMPRLPIETIAHGSIRGKRLLIGTNRDESAVFIGPHPDHDPVASDLCNLPLAAFDPRLARYAALYPAMSEPQRRVRAVSAEEYWVPSVREADACVRGGGQAWMYRLDFTETSGNQQGEAYHGLDVGLVWDKPHKGVANASAEAALAAQVHAAWASFLRGETPAAPGLPAWPAYHPGDRPTLVLDTQSRVEMRPQDAELHLWDGVL